MIDPTNTAPDPAASTANTAQSGSAEARGTAPLAPAPPARGGLSLAGGEILLTEDSINGMAWWFGLAEPERRIWLAKGGSGRPADAWKAFQASQARRDA